MPQVVSRGCLVLVTLFIVILYYVPIGHVDFAENWGEGTFGITLPLRTTNVVGVDRGSPADRAGLRVGDRLMDNGDYEIASRVRAPYAGERESLIFERGHARITVTLTAQADPNFGLVQRIGGVLAYIPPTVFLIVAFLLVFLRPSIMSWSFYIFAVGYFGTSPAFMYWSHVLSPPAYQALAFVLSTVFGPWSVLPLLPFVLRFPNGDVLGWRRRVDPFVWAFLRPFLSALRSRMAQLLRGGRIAPGLGRRAEHNYSPGCLCLGWADTSQELCDCQPTRPPTL